VAERLAMSKTSAAYPRRLSEFIKPCLGETFARQGFAAADIVTRWSEIVGNDIAAHAEPMKLQWPRSDVEHPEPATLVLRAEGPAAVEIQHLAEVILGRVNRFFGWRAVKRIAIRQGPLTPRRFSSTTAGPDPQTVARVENGLPEMKNCALRQALARLGAGAGQA
jgi:hypothetical protein